MPATDQTCYNMRKLHKAFAASSVLLLLVTIWMFTVDHNRMWKRVQRTSDRIDLRMTEWRKLQVLTEDVMSERERLQQALSELQSKELPAELLAAFREEVRTDAERRQAAVPLFTELDERVARMNASSAAAQETRRAWQAARLNADRARLEADDAAVKASGAGESDREVLQRTARELQAASAQAVQAEEQALTARLQTESAALPHRQEVLAELQASVDAAKFRQESLLRQRKFELSELDVAKAKLGLAVRDAKPPETLRQLQADIDRRKADIDQGVLACEAAAEHRQRLQNVVQQIADTELVVRKKLEANLFESRRLDQILEEKRSSYFTFYGILPVPGKKWLELPILDAFNSPRKIDNLWSEGLDQPAGSFGRVRRFDRCATCHQGIQTELVNAPTQPLFQPESTIDFALELPQPPSEPTPQAANPVPVSEQSLQDLFGLQLAQDGLLQPLDLTVRLVQPNSPAARRVSGNPLALRPAVKTCAAECCSPARWPRMPHRWQVCWWVTSFRRLMASRCRGTNSNALG